MQAAVDHLYRLAVTEAKATSTRRLACLADYCVEQLASRGLSGATTETALPGAGRPKSWDVSWAYDGKVRLAISLKSLLANLGGTVPNRIDDLMGEVANLQLYSPEVVIGYLMVFDVQADGPRQADGLTWADFLEERLRGLAGRRPPAWTIGTIEAVRFLRVDFSEQARLLTDPAQVETMFDELVGQVIQRNPGLRV